MTPYYQDDHVTIYHGRNEEVVPTLDPVGLVLTSPPYNLSGDGNKPSGTYFRNLQGGYATYTDDLPHPEYVAWQRSTLAMLWDALTEDGAIFYNHKPRVGGERVTTPYELVPEHMPIRQLIVWDRLSGLNRQFTYFVPARLDLGRCRARSLHGQRAPRCELRRTSAGGPSGSRSTSATARSQPDAWPKRCSRCEPDGRCVLTWGPVRLR